MGNDSCEASSTAASPAGGHVVVVEDDPFPRLLQVILDPGCDPERVQAFRHFLSLDLADFEAGTKVSGQKFYYLKNEAALLEIAQMAWPEEGKQLTNVDWRAVARAIDD